MIVCKVGELNTSLLTVWRGVEDLSLMDTGGPDLVVGMRGALGGVRGQAGAARCGHNCGQVGARPRRRAAWPADLAWVHVGPARNASLVPLPVHRRLGQTGKSVTLPDRKYRGTAYGSRDLGRASD
jgi:hypothetical protein